MKYKEFIAATKSALPPGKVISNPKSGKTTILKHSPDTLVYQRGDSKFYAPLRVFFDAFERYEGFKLSSSVLRKWAPGTFDSRRGGHSCHCTMLFLILVELDIAESIQGRGVAGDPFYVLVGTLDMVIDP